MTWNILRKAQQLGRAAFYYQKPLGTARDSLLAYWPLWDVTGTAIPDISGKARNGTATGFDLLYPGIGDGRSCPNLDGVNDLGNVYSAGLAGDFNGAEGSLMAWFKVSGSGVWTDGIQRQIARFAVDANNRATILKSSSNNVLSYQYIAGGVASAPLATSISSLVWNCMLLTWSKSADQVKGFLNGVQVDTTKTGLGVFAGTLVSSGASIGSSSGSAAGNVWSGTLAHVALWSIALTAAQVAYLSKVA